MRAHCSNAAWGVLDYAAYPAAMLASAPTLLRHLGTAQYGIWIVTMAALNAGAIIASGFGDANIQYIASARTHADVGLLLRSVRSILGINLLLGAGLALVSWVLAPFAAAHLVGSESDLRSTCLLALRVASVLILVRAIESVCISTQRAFERYGAAVRISLFTRLITVAAALVLCVCGSGVAAIMQATAGLMMVGTTAQFWMLRQYLGGASLLPSIRRHTVAVLFEFGAFSWLLAVSGVVFTQADRLLLGVAQGATAVTAYALCVQIAQPIYGLAASALHFIFPYLSARSAMSQAAAVRKAVLVAFAANLLMVSMGTVVLLLFGRTILYAWVGRSVAQSAVGILAPITWSFALLGLSVTGYYSLLALGKVRAVTALNLTGGLTMLLLMVWLLPLWGMDGLAMARLCYGFIALLIYAPLARVLGGARALSLSPAGTCPVCEEI